MIIYFARHGQSQANANNIVSPTDTPLTQLGIQQAKELAVKIKNKHIHTIICSPLARAQNTASILADALSIPSNRIFTVDELQERHLGRLTGQPRLEPNAFYYNTNDSYGMEPRQALIDRMIKAWARVNDIAANCNHDILVIGHCISGFYLGQVIRGHVRFEDFDEPQHLDNASFVTLATTN